MGFIRNRIARNIALLREQKGLTQRELAENVGVKHNAVSNWESGKNSPDIEKIFDLADYFKVNVSDIFGQESSGEIDYILSKKEKDLIDAFRALNQVGRDTSLHQVQAMVGIHPAKESTKKRVI